MLNKTCRLSLEWLKKFLSNWGKVFSLLFKDLSTLLLMTKYCSIVQNIVDLVTRPFTIEKSLSSS